MRMPVIDVSHAKSPGLLRRLAVTLYDLLGLLALLMFAAALIVIPYQLVFDGPLYASPAYPLFLVYLLAVVVAYYSYFWTAGRFSIGMRAWRVRLVTRAGEPLSLSDALRRLGWGLATLVPLGLISMYLDPDRLSWQDRLSGTRPVILAKQNRKAGDR
jgi:uncharacterized RDD family membrane protein YckC